MSRLGRWRPHGAAASLLHRAPARLCYPRPPSRASIMGTQLASIKHLPIFFNTHTLTCYSLYETIAWKIPFGDKAERWGGREPGRGLGGHNLEAP